MQSEDDWFGSKFIVTLSTLAATGLIALVVWEWRHKDPIVDVRLFKNFNFALTNVMFLMLGVALFSTTVLMPQLLQTLMGYTAEEAGLVLSVGAVAMLLLPPLVGQLTTRVQARFLIAVGWLLLAVSVYVSARTACVPSRQLLDNFIFPDAGSGPCLGRLSSQYHFLTSEKIGFPHPSQPLVPSQAFK